MPSRAERMALRAMQLGAVAIVFAATTHRLFDLDRFLVPKELVLHLTAAIAGLLTLRRLRVDKVLLLFLALSAASALFATNHWLAGRAFAVSVSSVVLYSVARRLREVGLSQRLLNALALGIVLAIGTSLLQAYGGWLELFTTNRAPGGTLGNRNFVAHAAAFGFPLVLLAALRARRFVFPAIGVGLVTAALVLTRSRAAWLAFGAMLVVFVIAAPLRLVWRRMLVVIVCVGLGVAAALLLPNALRWRSDNPYLDTAKNMANVQKGSGHGRLVQYQQSMMMAVRHPILGVGPGNWGVEYPAHATRNDPSLDDNEDGMTSNPWPSSDWVAFASERGFAAMLVLAVFVLLVARDAFRAEDRLDAATLLAVLAAACVAGAFDAVLLLALPSFFVWSALGALTPPHPPFGDVAPRPAARGERGRRPGEGLLTAILVLLALLASVYCGMKIAGMNAYTNGAIAQAARLDPGNYRAQLRLGRRRCASANAAHALYPYARAARDLAKRCRD